MHKGERLFIRWSAADAAFARAAALKLGVSVSEFVRRATTQAAMQVLQGGTASQKAVTVTED